MPELPVYNRTTLRVTIVPLRYKTYIAFVSMSVLSHIYIYILNETSKPPVNKTHFSINSLIIQPFEIIFGTVILVTSIRRLNITNSDSIRMFTNA